jgi:arabinoxylan arabinofuranohydrolase
MKITYLLVGSLLIVAASTVAAQNPVITHMYTADPSARVFNDTLYLYPSHDRDDARWWDMVDYHVFSTTDMVNFKDHGRALHIDNISWAEKYAWAPDAIKRDGKYYFYFPTDQSNIGVAVADRPYGPFRDPLGKPLITKDSPGVVNNRDFIDPAVFIDDNGKAYLFVGQNAVNAIELNDDMISWSGEVRIIEGLDHFFEAIWMHKYNGKYYLSYSGDGQILYAWSDEIFGPYEFKGEILGPVNSGTNHHSIVEYKGKWYLFYHNSDLALLKIPEDSEERKYVQWRRSVSVDRLFYNDDGTIQKVNPTKH